jgi:hypothetical protein
MIDVVIRAGLVFLVVGNLLVPVAISTGTQTPLNFTVLALPMLTGLWVLTAAYRSDWAVLRARPGPPLLALTVAALLSFAIVNQPWVHIVAPLAPLPAQLGGLSVFLLSAGLFFTAADKLQDRGWLAFVTWTFVALAAVYMTGRLALPGGLLVLPYFQKGAEGSLLWTWSVALAFGQAAFNRRLNIVLRLALAVFVGATFYVAVTQGRDWASGWLPPLIAVVTIIWVGAPRVGMVLTGVACVIAVVYAPHLTAMALGSDNEYSLMTRLAAWGVLAEIVQDSPALGLGPANYYHVTPLFPILGWYVKFSSHNTYADLLLQTGIIGVGCFVWFAWEMARTGWGLRRLAPPGFAYGYVISALGGLAGTLAAGMLCDWILPFVYNITLEGMRASTLGWLFLGGLLALQRSVAPEDRE